jgi:hypothetical protein
MLHTAEIETIRTALSYWRDEMCSQDRSLLRPYFDRDDVRSLSAEEVDDLRDRLADRVCYVAYDPVEKSLIDRT